MISRPKRKRGNPNEDGAHKPHEKLDEKIEEIIDEILEDGEIER